MPLTREEVEKKGETLYKKVLDAGQTNMDDYNWGGYTWPIGLDTLDKTKIKAYVRIRLRSRARIAELSHNGQQGGTRKRRRRKSRKTRR